jgi:hypothetical protein
MTPPCASFTVPVTVAVVCANTGAEVRRKNAIALAVVAANFRTCRNLMVTSTFIVVSLIV